MISAETIVAYVDGELDAAGRAEVESAASVDPAVADQIAAHRQLRSDLFAAFAPVAAEPVPERLVQAAAPPSATVLPFRARLSRPLITQIAAMAACLVAGIALAVVLRPAGEVTTSPDGLIARGQLDRALSSQLAADDGRTRIGLTFRDTDGAVCRTFATQVTEGLACRHDGRWQIEVASRAAPKTEFTQAGSPLILDAVDARISGDPLDSAAERQARDLGWR